MGFFDGVRQSEQRTSAGAAELPILYRDASVAQLYYRVRPALAAATLPEGLEPLVVAGRALVVLAIFDYRETTIGPYGELGLAVMAKREGARISWRRALRTRFVAPQTLGLHVLNLPVTMERARAAGVELWGYPKYVTSIDTDFDARGLRCRLGDELRLEILGRRGLVAGGLPMCTLSASDGRWLRTVVRTSGRGRWSRARVRTDLRGEGPTRTTFERLGLDRTQPSALFVCERFQAILPLGEDVVEAPVVATAPRAGDTRRLTEAR